MAELSGRQAYFVLGMKLSYKGTMYYKIVDLVESS